MKKTKVLEASSVKTTKKNKSSSKKEEIMTMSNSNNIKKNGIIIGLFILLILQCISIITNNNNNNEQIMITNMSNTQSQQQSQALQKISKFDLIHSQLLLMMINHNNTLPNEIEAIQYYNHYIMKSQQQQQSQVVQQPNQQPRVPFHIEEWDNNHKGNGGLTDDDRIVLGKYYYHANSIYEVGIGESTLIAAHTNVPKYVGVEGDAHWIANMQYKIFHDDTVGASSKIPPNFHFIYGDIGPIHNNGYSMPKYNIISEIKSYHYQIAGLLTTHEAFDVYYIDGRYRVATACISFLHSMKYKKGNRSSSYVLIHDNDELHRGYHIIQQFANKIQNDGTKKLWIYQLPTSSNNDDDNIIDTLETQIYNIWKQHVFNTN